MKKTGKLEKLKTKINHPIKANIQTKYKTHKKTSPNIRVDYPKDFFLYTVNLHL